MNLYISKVHIKNFRSIRDLTIEPKNLAILAGKNDSGKSNILRALNLFFNDETVPNTDFNFDIDHNVNNKPNKKAKEISIELEIEMPESYRHTNGDFITWKRCWRAEGRVFDKYSGQRRNLGVRGGKKIDPVEIPKNSNAHALLRNIKFEYVPAIKDANYFSRLRADIYNIISIVAEDTLRKSSGNFEQSIADQIKDLMQEITSSLNFKSRMALPKNLRHVFASLDFLSEESNISLNERGDGIKARHIPLILKFMADKMHTLQVRGAAPHTFIWGYEEPENNLEFSSCVKLADQFRKFIDSGISQIFLTTHSPAFYNLKRESEKNGSQISCHNIFQEMGIDGALSIKGTKELSNPDDIDERMGATALIANLLEGEENKIRRQTQAKTEAKQLAETNRQRIFVEGESDKLIIGKALKVFAPDKAHVIDVETKENGGGGVNYVSDMLFAWHSNKKHKPEMSKVAGLLDNEKETREISKKWNNGKSDNINSAKCFLLPRPPHLHDLLDAGFNLPIVLECLYDKENWQWADNKGYLEERKNIDKLVPRKKLDEIMQDKTTVTDLLCDEWAIYIKKNFKFKFKVKMANRYAQFPDDEFRERMSFMKETIEEIVNFLFK